MISKQPLRLLFIILILGWTQLLSAQTISLNKKNLSFPEIFKEIYKQTGYYFYYDADAMNKTARIDVNVKNATLDQVLAICFKGQSLVYNIQDKVITVRDRTTPEKSPPTNGGISGKILDEEGHPVEGASVVIKGTGLGVASSDQGAFTLRGVSHGTILVISHIGFESIEVRVTENAIPAITLKHNSHSYQSVDVELSTGYQKIPRERATGSFDQIDNALINRSVSTNILDRLDGVSSGVIFNKNINTSANQSSIAIRGRSTIYSNPNPLIVVDNFPYDGDLSTINPNDVENITILKDAAAASIWGSSSGNGVIVITTKKGRYGQPTQINFNTNMTLGERPNVWYSPQISPSDDIDLQTYLYGKGFYTRALSTSYGFVPPVANILSDKDNGTITPGQAGTQINALRNLDVRNDLSKYFYQQSFNQQYALNLQGGADNHLYYFSVGLDENRPNMTYNKYQRLTLDASNTYAFLDHRLELLVDLSFQQSHTTTDNNGYAASYPYAQLANGNGQPLAINSYRQSYLDTAGQGLLLDWNDRPVDELRLADNTSTLINYRVNTGLKYRWKHGMSVDLLYQYSAGNTQGNNYQSDQTYYTRNLINSFTQIDAASGTLINPVPLGGILDLSTSAYTSNDGRGQLNYAHSWKNDHRLNVIAGTEVRSVTTETRTSRVYGYDPTLQESTPVDNVDFFPNYILPYSSSTIPNNISNIQTVNRYFSYFANAGYSYRLKYTLSGSFRRDESNLFGVSANQKGVPLWSAGAGWEISRESFYHSTAMPYLRLRITEGYNGNINNSISAYTTSSVSSFPNNYNANFQNISNPPNPQLQWERIHVMNAGVDFGTKNKRLDGSIEYYIKNGENLIGQSPVAPQTGFPLFTGNTASMKGSGMDITINTINISHRDFRWTTNLLLSINHDEVSVYNVPVGSLYQYMNLNTLNPLVGHPLYSIYGYKSLSLDSAGNPRGVLQGSPSENYGGIENSQDFSSAKYIGAANPTVFGSLRNTFTKGPFSFSFNITYKFGYYFRRPSLNEYELITLSSAAGGTDYSKRWQNPGDEKSTTVPSLVYPVNNARSDFYTYSDRLVDKGDNIRLQDLQMSYDITARQWKKMPGKSARIYLYARNIGILWKANKDRIDPDAVPVYGKPVFPDPRTYAAGLNIQL